MSGKLKICGYYRVNQPIDNLKIRVKIVQQKSLLAELFESEYETRDPNFLEIEEKTFQWQEKVFSSKEIKIYSNENNCKNDIEKNYYEEIINNNIEGSRLYSYTKNDHFKYDKNPVTKDNYKSMLSIKNKNALPKIPNRKPYLQRYNKKVVDYNPSDFRIRSNHYLFKNEETMYIMVDLTSKDETIDHSKNNEILLCKITYDKSSNLLIIDPDFSDDCYTVESCAMNYDYWIEHVSVQPDQQEIEQLINSDQEIGEKKLNQQVKLYNQVQQPPSNVVRLFLTLDFTKAYGFDYNSLFLTYVINLPKHWSTNDRDRLSGRSQRCKMINGMAHFSFITEISLDFDLNSLKEKNNQPCWPHLIISIASLDSWTRYRMEGYTSIPLPSTSAFYKLKLKTWQPINGVINSLRRYFTGGVAELNDITYCGIPRDHRGNELNKTKLKVTPSGTVEFQINIILQNKNFIKKNDEKKLNTGTLMDSVDYVLQQFQAARKRMLQAQAIDTFS